MLVVCTRVLAPVMFKDEFFIQTTLMLYYTLFLVAHYEVVASSVEFEDLFCVWLEWQATYYVFLCM
jgi:hypothetical protein